MKTIDAPRQFTQDLTLPRAFRTRRNSPPDRISAVCVRRAPKTQQPSRSPTAGGRVGIQPGDRGVLFDVGHGLGSFAFKTARAMLANGFLPDTISSDVHQLCINGPAFDLVTTMSKFLAMGMPLEDVVRRSTVAPAEWIKRPDIGTLTPGRPADIAVLEFQDRPCGLSDSGPTGYRVMQAKGRLVCQLTIRRGSVVWDQDGRSKDEWTETPKTDLDYP